VAQPHTVALTGETRGRVALRLLRRPRRTLAPLPLRAIAAARKVAGGTPSEPVEPPTTMSWCWRPTTNGEEHSDQQPDEGRAWGGQGRRSPSRLSTSWAWCLKVTISRQVRQYREDTQCFFCCCWEIHVTAAVVVVVVVVVACASKSF